MKRLLILYVFLVFLIPCHKSIAAFLAESESSPFSIDTSIPFIDTDSDGMNDAWETSNGLNVGLDDSALDADNDGYTNIQEYNSGSNPQLPDPPNLPFSLSALFLYAGRPLIADTDNDGMPDAWETANGLNVGIDDSASDLDSDGLSNVSEYNSGTDPQIDDWSGPSIVASTNTTVDTGGYFLGWGTDTDGDKMPDWWEDKYGLNRLVDDSGDDFDSDGVNNLDEYLLGMKPDVDDVFGIAIFISALWEVDCVGRPTDTDKDGMPDIWEIAYGLNHLVDDSGADPDNDGRSNIDEYNANTDPQIDDWSGPSIVASTNTTVDTGGYNGGYALDSDGDKMPDWWENKYSLNPSGDDTADNPDGDALNNLEEYNSGTNPQLFDWYDPCLAQSTIFLLDTGGYLTDTDGDGIANWWERKFFGSLTNAIAGDDEDKDGMSNLKEWISNTSPIDRHDYFHIQKTGAVTNESDEMVIYWDTVPNRKYSIFTVTNITTTWTNKIFETQGNGTRQAYTNTLPNARRRFFRIKVELLP